MKDNTQQILGIGKKHYPQATDMEIMSAWKTMKQKDPNITPEMADKLLPQIGADVASKMPGTPVPVTAQVPQAQEVSLGKMPEVAAPSAVASGPDLSALSAALGYKGKIDKGTLTPDDEKAMKLKALQTMFSGGK